MAKAVNEVGGAVHRVQNPEGAGGVDGLPAALFPQKLHSRGQLFQLVPEEVLYGEVHIGDKVGVIFGGDGVHGGGVGQQGPRLAHGLHRLVGQFLGQNAHAMAPLVRMET